MKYIHLSIIIAYIAAFLYSGVGFEYLIPLLLLKVAYLILVIFMKRNSGLYLLDFFLIIWGILIEIPSLLVFSQEPNPEFIQGIFAFALPNLMASIFAIFRETYILKQKFIYTYLKINYTDRLYIIIMGIISCIIAAIYLKALKEIPIITALTSRGSTVDLNALRNDSLKSLEVPGYLLYLIAWARDFMFPIAASGSIILALRDKKFPKIIALIFSFVGLFFISASTEKAPISFFIFSILLTIVVYFRINRIKINKIMLAVLGIPIVAIPIFLLAIGAQSSGVDSSQSLESGVTNFINRAFLVPSRVALIHFDVFPSRLSFLEGSSMNVVNELAGKEFFNLANYLYVYYNPYDSTPDSYGYANGSFISEIWANFSWVGVFIVSLLCAFFISMGDLIYITSKKNVLVISSFSAMFIAILGLISGNFTIFLITKGFVIQLVLLFFVGRINSLNLPLIKNVYNKSEIT